MSDNELPLAHLCKMKVCACKVVADRADKAREKEEVKSDANTRT